MGKIKFIDGCVVTSNKDVLHKISEPVDINNISAYQAVIDKLLEYMELNPKVQGVSAIQFSSPNRICCMRLKGNVFILINPTIVFTLGKKTSLEHCESCKDYWKLPRPIISRVEYYNEHREVKKRFFLRRGTRIIHHEVDHMNGLLITDKGKRWLGSVWVNKH